MSPTPDMAAMAVNAYLAANDSRRVTVPLKVENARVLDFRTPEAEAFLGLEWRETAVPWQDQRALGEPATSWRASDGARELGADGMLYPSRQRSYRWHLVLFHWNCPGGPQIRIDGPEMQFSPKSAPLVPIRDQSK